MHCYTRVEEGNLHYKAHCHRVEEQYLPSPTVIYFCQLCMNSWCEAFEVFCSFAFFKSTQLSSDKGQEHKNADFFILEKDIMNLSIYAEIARAFNIFHCGKPNHGSSFFLLVAKPKLVQSTCAQK